MYKVLGMSLILVSGLAFSNPLKDKYTKKFEKLSCIDSAEIEQTTHAASGSGSGSAGKSYILMIAEKFKSKKKMEKCKKKIKKKFPGIQFGHISNWYDWVAVDLSADYIKKMSL